MKRVSPTIAEIDLEALRHNYRQLRDKLPAGVRPLCVVKSNAYGHGAGRVGRTLQDEGCEFFGVGTVDEAVELREAGVKRPILILLGIIDDQIESLLRYQLTPVIYDLPTAEKMHRSLIHQKKKFPIHIKIDTGMTRLGVLPKEFANFCTQLKTLTTLEPEGLLSHLAEAGDKKFTQHQKTAFDKAVETFEESFPPDGSPRYYHLSNSQGVMDVLTKPITALAGVQWLSRLGLALYGAYPLERDRKAVELKPVMTWKTKILQIKNVAAGTPVSYNRTFVTKKAARIGILPVGYADGYPRLLSNQASVLVGGKRAPVAGMVCMDLTMIDLTSHPKACVGDDVILMGRQGREDIRAEELAKIAKTISYEIFCRVSPRVTRVYTS